jgi:phosphomannomutase/phosphoglucomutase
MKINPYIFRQYDIRGVAGTDLTTEVAELIGRATGSYLLRKGKKKVSVGRDCRLSSPELAAGVIKGFRATGCDVVDLGLCTTPAQYFSLHTLEDVQGGIMITGSHNPPDNNGFKVSCGTDSVYGEEIQVLRSLIENDDFEQGDGTLSETDILTPYKEHLKGCLKLERPLKVIIDSGNGTGGLVAPEVYRAMGCEVEELFSEPDGNFPNHHPDPTVAANLQEMISRMQDGGYDLGIGFDGDADRIGAVDERGNIIWGDHLMILFARDVLAANPGATIISEVKSSVNLYDDIAKHGGKGIMWKTGHSLIKAKMQETGALLSGEMSGHICFKDRFFGFDDAVYAGARLMELVAKSGKKPAELLSDLPKTFSTPEIRSKTSDDKKFEIIKKVRDYFAADYKVIDIDGVRVIFDDGWGLVRASNTEPVLGMRFEAKSEARLAEIQKLVQDKVTELSV